MDTIYINGKPDSCLIEPAPFYRPMTSKRVLKSLSKSNVVLKDDVQHCNRAEDSFKKRSVGVAVAFEAKSTK